MFKIFYKKNFYLHQKNIKFILSFLNNNANFVKYQYFNYYLMITIHKNIIIIINNNLNKYLVHEYSHFENGIFLLDF